MRNSYPIDAGSGISQGGGQPMNISSTKRFYLSVAWTAAIIIGGLAMLISFVTHA